MQIINPHIPVIPIVIIIITALFTVQQFGTKLLGESFGPIMFIWFSMLGILGISQIVHFPAIIKSINPYYAYNLLMHHKGGFILLGAVFLATTGAEALYSDLGHCGIRNTRISWIFVKLALILNYMGQGAWVLTHTSEITNEVNPFFSIMPPWFIVPGVLLATAAAVIASQALISGSFTLVSEAISLNFWPKLKMSYPTYIKGQVYISSINWLLWISCIFVVLYFEESSNMEAAYGLSISITMIMTTILLSIYLYKRISLAFIIPFVAMYIVIEGAFLIANLYKFANGGWVTILMAFIIILVMYAWYMGRKIKNSFVSFVKVADYVEIIKSLAKDESVPKFATNLVYLTKANRSAEMESKIIYSIISKQPKRADVYWFIHVDILDDPDTFEYKVVQIEPGVIIKVEFRLGFKVEPRINLYFRQVLEELSLNREVDVLSRYESLRQYSITADFMFILIDRIPNYDFDLNLHQKFVLNLNDVIRNFGITEVKALGLDTSNVIIEKVPLTIIQDFDSRMKRVD